MFYGLSLLAGMLISVMVVFNGGLNAQLGFGLSMVTIHVAGLLAIALVMLFKREKPAFPRIKPLWYTAGVLGILTTVFNLVAFGHISVSAMMALGLLGESISSLLVDHFGLMGIPVLQMRREKIWGFIIILAGIAIMLTDFVLVPVVVSFCAGITVLLSRLVNGGLSRKSSVTNATLVNYLVGLIGASLLSLFLGIKTPIDLTGPFTNYLGGAVGTVIVIISNFVVGKIASFYMTLTLFVGQVTAGLLLDMMLQGSFPVRIALGGLFVLLGLTLNLWQDRAHALRQTQGTQSA
ncbi:MAG: DMT family transporter [Clostridiales bacterium]|nr:DMT family transporter [Clostridiales bacterium]